LLQDLEAGRPFEKDAILTAVQAMAREAGVAIPYIDMAAALLQGLERNVVLSKL
jgi:ketopantoate reductase